MSGAIESSVGCGLFTSAERSPVPLQGVRIDARLSDLCVEVRVTQRYKNTESSPIEAVYVFPLDEGAAVCGFTAKIGNRLVKGRVEEREKAFETYDDAMADGHGAYLLDQERPNVFTASVGNLNPGQEVEIGITYVAEARYEGEAVRLMIPTTVSPRYVPAPNAPEVGQPEGERVNPERMLSVPYGLTLSVDVQMGQGASGGVRLVESPSHPVRTELTDEGARVELSHAEAALDRDFVLLVTPRETGAPRASVAVDSEGQRVAMVSFRPELELDESVGHDVWFLIDCSGSMQGSSIDQARRAAELCIRALSENDTFNILRFGSGYESLFKTPQRVSDRSIDEASTWLRSTHANLGGTEILTPLKVILNFQPDPERLRQVLLLTDGQVSNEAAVLQLAQDKVDVARIFTFGIGYGASEHLVRGAARNSRGACELIHPGERIEPKVLRMFNRVRSPALTNVRMDWGGMKVVQSPKGIPPIFSGDAVTLYARVDSGVTDKVTLKADGHAWEVAVDMERATKGGPVPTLWARERIRELEGDSGRHGSAQNRQRSQDRKQRELIELGVRYGLVSSATSFVAVEERGEDDQTTEQAQLRKVPVALTHGWGGFDQMGSPTAVGGPAPAFGDKTQFVQTTFASAAAPSAPPAAPSREELRARRLARLADTQYRGGGGLSGAADKVSRLFRRKKKRPATPPTQITSEELDRLAEARGLEVAHLEYRFEERTAAGTVDWTAVIYEVLATQKANGSFEWSVPLELWLAAEAAGVQANFEDHGEAVVCTVVVLELLGTRAAHMEDQWRQAAKKAWRWLESQADVPEAADLLG